VQDNRGLERHEVVVIGAGQAGLAAGFELSRSGLQFTILEAGNRIGDSWRHRWEGLRLFTAARYDGLPGMPFPAAPWTCPTKDEVADYLETYADTMSLPVQMAVRVESLRHAEGGSGFTIAADSRRFAADQVVVATGAYHAPRTPTFAGELDASIRQLHSSDYRDASQLQPGPVLVVGASNSGAEIAMSASREHRVILAGRDTGKMPMRPESRTARLFDPPFWWFINRILRTDSTLGRRALPFVRDQGGPLERVWPEDLKAAGVERVTTRVSGVAGGKPCLDDGRALDVANVVWCTGFRPSFGWIELPLPLDDGWPVHRRGVIEQIPGLYFIGLPFLYTAASALIGGVGRDAAFLADLIERTARSGVLLRYRSSGSAVSPSPAA